jgi:hypothetical protein
MFDTVNDAVDVVAAFEGTKIRPVRFRWRGRAIAVKEVTSRWVRREGMVQRMYFAVQGPAQDTYELCFEPREITWVLSKAAGSR